MGLPSSSVELAASSVPVLMLAEEAPIAMDLPRFVALIKFWK